MTEVAENSNVATTPVAAPIRVNFDNKLDYKGSKFSFKTVKDKDTGVETKRATIELDKIPVPSVEGVVAILEIGGKSFDLLMEAVTNVVLDRARDVINADEKITSENFPYDLLNWNVIAELEKEDRRSAIPKEVWEEFAVDFTAIMPSLSGITSEQAANVAKILIGRFAAVKSRKDIISKLQGRVALYAEHSTRAAEFADVIDTLYKKAEKLLEAKEEKLEDNLGL